MKLFIFATLATAVLGNSVPLLPAGVSPADCAYGTYPFCGQAAPAALPTPVVNNQPVAPILNTLPDQTLYYQEAQVAKSPAHFPQPIINNEPVAPVLNTVPAQTRAVENHQLIAAQQQLEQLKAQQIIQIRQQQQEIEAARHFGRL